MHVFYAPEISKTLRLPQDESYHAIRVLRLRLGALIHVVDGSGGFYEAKIQTEDSASVALLIIKEQQNYGARNFHLHLALAPTKNTDRFEYFLEKAVEIGVDEITPITCEHSERFKLRMDRLERIVISAMKQSYKAFKPKLNALTDFSSALENVEGLNGLAHCADIPRVPIKQFLYGFGHRANDLSGRINVFIGPEGDFSPDEINAAEGRGFTGISLGSSRLRTETAGVVACYAVHHELGITS
jgi:16S rRNA (uracil1498-N3)-methyltransferase